MRVALDCRSHLDNELLDFGRQLGCVDIVAGYPTVPPPMIHGHVEPLGYYDFLQLVHLKQRVEERGMRVAAIENVPYFWYDKVIRGQAGRDQQIENWMRTLRNMGRAGIPILGYHFMAAGGTDTSREPVGRGGAMVRRVRYALVDAPGKEDNRLAWRDIGSIPQLTDDQMWANITYFLKAVVPVAEEAGVKMALHPDDPPISPVLGTACIIRSHTALRRVVEEIAPSDHSGLEFCQGTISEMPDDVYEAIRYFGTRKKIFYVHFRNVSGKVPDFDETFVDDGYVDMWKAMRIYNDVGYNGVFIEDHVPAMTGDSPHGHRSRAFAMGYAKGLMRMTGAR